MDINPYEPPNDESLPASSTETFRVEGDYLVVRDGTLLPRRCIATNSEVDDGDIVEREFRWAPSFRPVLTYRRCKVKFYVTQIRQRIWLLKRSFGGLTFVLLGFFLFRLSPLLILPLLVALPWMFKDYPIRVKRVADGWFWFEGCHPEFLQVCREEEIHRSS